MHPEDFLSLEEWHGLLKVVQSPREAALLWLLRGAGLRVSEVATLKVEHLDGPGGYLHVVNGKGGKQRTSILPKPVLEALDAHLQDRGSGYIFKGRDMAISTRQIQRLLDEAAQKAALQETRKGKVRQRMRIMRQFTCRPGRIIGGRV
jgi:integrase/recombinase XerD